MITAGCCDRTRYVLELSEAHVRLRWMQVARCRFASGAAATKARHYYAARRDVEPLVREGKIFTEGLQK